MRKTVNDNPSKAAPVTALIAALLAPSAQAAEPTLDDLLELDIGALRQVKVTAATRIAQPLAEVPANVRVVTAEQIRRRGYRTLDQALADLPGLQFRNIQGFNSYTFMRGAPSQNNLLLVLVDGVQVNELNSGGFYGGGHYNLDNVKHIEVIYGPASVLYGTNAVSGVINIVTYSPQDNAGGEFVAAYGQYDTGRASLRSSHYDEASGFGYSFAAMLNSADKGDLGGAEGDGNWGEGMENFERDHTLEGKIAWKGFDFGLLYQEKSASRTTNYRSTGSDYLDAGTDWHIRFANLWARHRHDFSDTLELESRLYFRDATVLDDTIGYIRDNTTHGQVAYYRPNQLWGLDERLLYNDGERTKAIIGVTWERERLAEGFSQTRSGDAALPPPTPGEPDHVDNRLFSLYAEGQRRLSEHFTVTAGLRRDNSSVYGWVTNPRLGAIYDDGDLSAKLLYGEAFRAPKPWDYTFGVGNGALEPEEMESLEGVVGYRFNANLSAELALYRNTISNKLVRDSNVNRWINQGEQQTEGAEITLDYRRGAFGGYLNYSYTDSRDDNDAPTDEIARHGLNLGVDYRLNERVDLNLRANYIGERPNPVTVSATGEAEIDDAWVVNGSIGYRDVGGPLDGWDLRLVAENLFDNEWYHSSNRPPERYRQPQRTFWLEARYGFD